MARDRYQKGSTIRVRATFKDADTKALKNPDTVTLLVQNPDKTTTDLTSQITPLSTGLYECLLPLVAKGTYYWHWRGNVGSTEVAVIPGSCDSFTEVDI